MSLLGRLPVPPHCAPACPCSAAFRYHLTASTSSFPTPWPFAYMMPRLVLRPGVSLLGCLPPPPHRLHVVLPHSLAVGVHDAQVGLSYGVSLLGRLPEPPHRLHVVLPHSPAA